MIVASHEGIENVVDLTPAELLGELSEAEAAIAPARLYVAGDLGPFRRAARVSVVGSRSASEAGVRRARRLCAWLCDRGAVVVGGLVPGVDTAVHEAAAEAGGHSAAVTATSLDRCYPPGSAELQRTLAQDQLVVSPFPTGTKSRPEHLIEQARLMALLSDVTVIIEATDRSLSLTQAWEALRLGRAVFIGRSLVQNAELAWPATMLGRGASVLANETLDELAARLPARATG